MPDLVRLIQIKTAGPEGKHCDPECCRRPTSWCSVDNCATRYDSNVGLYHRTPECLRDARPAEPGAPMVDRGLPVKCSSPIAPHGLIPVWSELHKQHVMHSASDASCCEHYDTEDPTFRCEDCKRLVGWCAGGDKDSLCCDCWVEHQKSEPGDPNA